MNVLCKSLSIVLFFALQGALLVSGQEGGSLGALDTTGRWVHPSADHPSLPVWGHLNGIRMGIAPTSGPRGLLRIYTPYLGHAEEKMINFIAFEPIVAGEEYRGFSELEMSSLDGVRGKRFWSSNEPTCGLPLPVIPPATGVIERVDGQEALTLYIYSELFDNGARPYVRARFYEHRPYEIELTTFACDDSKELDHFILTATMGNFARLRELYLREEKKSSLQLWPSYTDIHFTLHDETPAEQMIRDNKGGVYFIAASDEESPGTARYAAGTREHWKYYGEKATQYWYVLQPREELVGLVNGRFTYWASESPIPGGISFENFEMKSPFKNGDRFVFGVTPLRVEQFIGGIKNNKW